MCALTTSRTSPFARSEPQARYAEATRSPNVSECFLSFVFMALKWLASRAPMAVPALQPVQPLPIIKSEAARLHGAGQKKRAIRTGPAQRNMRLAQLRVADGRLRRIGSYMRLAIPNSARDAFCIRGRSPEQPIAPSLASPSLRRGLARTGDRWLPGEGLGNCASGRCNRIGWHTSGESLLAHYRLKKMPKVRTPHRYKNP
jgi:hypothetical protein